MLRCGRCRPLEACKTDILDSFLSYPAFLGDKLQILDCSNPSVSYFPLLFNLIPWNIHNCNIFNFLFLEKKNSYRNWDFIVNAVKYLHLWRTDIVPKEKWTNCAHFSFYAEGPFVLDRNKCFELQVEITFSWWIMRAASI